MKNFRISVILPTYNEAGNIVPLINEVKNFLRSYNIEIIVVDDNSPDKTAEKVRDFFQKDKNIKLYIRKNNRGLAKSIYLGINKSKGDYIVIMDTDFNHNPKNIKKFISYIPEYKLIIGSRYVKGGGMQNNLRYYLSYLFNLSIRLLLGLETHDNLSGFFLIKKKVLTEFPENLFYGYGDYFLRLLYLADKKGIKIKEVPVFYNKRLSGVSKTRFFKIFYDYSKTVLSLALKQE